MAPGAVRLFVVHVAQGSSQSGIDAWFANPAAKVSAHFSVSRLGIIHQHVNIETIAWAEENYNDVAISIEHLGYSGQRLSRLQLRASLRLLRWLQTQFPSVPLRRTGNPEQHGIIGHGELGVSGGDHPDCPGWPILAQFNVALRAVTR
jgi:N-acetyl-anhydromuramyl-L-alanine amidase AmpD